MGKLKLYYDGLSQPCRTVYLFMKANKIDFELKHITIMKAETLSDEFRKINPFGGIPFIDDDGFLLPESVAIMIYLCNKYEHIPDHWYPKDIKKRARIDQYLAWQHSGIRRNAAWIFGEKAYKPYNTKQPVDQKAYEQHIKDLQPSLKKFEELYIQDDGFLFGNEEISIADLPALSELTQPICAQYDLTKDHPKIGRYMDRVKVRLQPIYDECFKRILYMGERLAEGKSGPDILPDDPHVL